MMRLNRSFVVREGRITKAQAKAYIELWSRYGCDLTTVTQLELANLFANKQKLRLEIGFGNGVSLVEMATTQPECNFLGVEMHRPGIGQLLLALEQFGINNVRVLRQDAMLVVQALPAASLQGVYILFPDPWPKSRHHKRRLIQPVFISALARVLQPQGFIQLATDWEHYAHWMLKVLNSCPDLYNASLDNTFITRPPERPLTHFEKRGLRLGHTVYDLLFYRV